MKNSLHRALSVALLALTAGAGPSGLAAVQNQEMQEKVAEVKQAIAQNKQAMAQYTWVEQVTILLKGEQKKQEHFQVRLGPDGKPQKESLDPPAQPPEHEGRLKKHIVEKKTEEYKEYADQIKALIQQYVPPERDLIEQAGEKGNIMIGPAAGEQGQYKLVLSNYVKQGDNMTLVFDKAQKDIVSLTIATYLSEPSDAVNVNVQFGRIPNGPNHVSSQTINGVSKKLMIAIENSNYQHF
jgi:hypothetical protein